MNEPLLSVIVPVYNAEKYIEECLTSITNSTYKNLEVIVINDGTKDKSAEIAKKLAEKDNRIKVFDFENGGTCVARNRGVKLAKGDYITFSDNDDIIDKNMYADLISKMQRYDLDVIKCGCFNGNTDNWHTKFSFPKEAVYEKEDIVHQILDKDFDGTMWIAVWNGIYKREIATKVEFPARTSPGEDTYASGMYLSLAKKIMTVKECYYYYRINPSAVTKGGMLKHPLDICLNVSRLVADLKAVGISSQIINQRLALELYYFCRAKSQYYRVKKIDCSLYNYIMKNLTNWRKKIRFFITCRRNNLL